MLESLGIQVSDDDVASKPPPPDKDEVAPTPPRAPREDALAGRQGEDILTASTRRKGHSIWARAVKDAYQWRCAISGIVERDFLVAGHILPWRSEHQLRLEPQNGICLSVFYDRALEQGYITLDNDYRILVSPWVTRTSPLGKLLWALEGQRITLPSRNPPALAILERHRNEIFLK